MTVKNFITQNPGVILDMMTPGGFVYLTPEAAQSLLDGKGTHGHPGHPEMAVEIEADELLSQNVHSFNFSDDTCHMLTEYSEEQLQGIAEIDSNEQEMTMC